MNTSKSDFLSLNFDQNFRTLPPAFYQSVDPQGLKSAELVALSDACADLLTIDSQSITTPDALAVLSANKPLPSSVPLAMKYTGHQFGYYNPDLGDGRGLLLADVIPHRSATRWDLHLKGAGLTPFSRQGDGRAVLRSSIREFLASEAMAALDIPTSRALCVLNSQTPVYREQSETAATVLRVSQTHLRFGHFEYAFHSGDGALLSALADYTIERHYPCLHGSKNRYADFFILTAKKTASLIANWQAVGFAHGVMNTDNMSILGETFDYGPFGFIDRFDPGYICNHSDTAGRYAYDRQPSIAHWNLSVLAHALSPIVEQDALSEGLQAFNQQFNDDYIALMSAKVGLTEFKEGDQGLIFKVLNMMTENKMDYSFFFRQLAGIEDQQTQTKLRDLCVNRVKFDECTDALLSRWQQDSVSCNDRYQAMNRVNPKYILRNHLAQIAISKAERGDYSEVQNLHQILQYPFDEQPDFNDYAGLPPDWVEQVEISCSS
jgi:uncharacterized protein YdiU (UPF0061 family)